MGHEVKAVVAPAPALRAFANRHGLERPAPLIPGWALLPMSHETLDQLFPQGTGSPVPEGFVQLGPQLINLLQQSFPDGAVYFETGYFGGSGGQCAMAVRLGRAVSGPSCSRSGEINGALQALGFVGNAGKDAFDTLGLGRHRLTSDWAEAAADQGAGAAFTLHWSRIPNPPADALPGVQVHALWPSPVNPDVCFTEAGFTDFQDADPSWDTQADALLQRVLDVLSTHFGQAQLAGPPIMQAQPWYRALLRRPRPLPLWEQVSRPMHDDRHEPAEVRFGSSRARLRGGGGHALMWIDWPSPAPVDFSLFAQAVAADAPVVQTELQWGALWPHRHR